ncbi:uncharacterized protein LOC127178468 isoform X2 [Labeo rohita]|uniref:uncharacterized protein LOC127178468 isoform X2 n=1 Tax=Labeo rohita TaxID=84645 RepID=UPI0021E27C8D|nr:uncharacterized protein LOC127178468 isoform X2 [Labeo rohita]
MDDWTKDDVCEWLIKKKVPEQYAKILYNQDVYGASLIHFDKQDLLESGLPRGPAVHIYKIVAEFKTSSENLKDSAIPKDTDASTGTSAVQDFHQEKEAAETTTTGSAELETPAQISIEENRDSLPRVKTWSSSSEDKPKYTSSEGKPFEDENVPPLEGWDDGMYTKEDEHRILCPPQMKKIHLLSLPSRRPQCHWYLGSFSELRNNRQGPFTEEEVITYKFADCVYVDADPFMC